MPTLQDIAMTITGPNETKHVSREKLRELQQLKWGRLKAQDQAHLLRAAGFVKALFDADPKYYDPEGLERIPIDRSKGATGAMPPPLPAQSHGGPPPLPHPAPRLADARSTQHVLQQFRAFVTRNASQWVMGAGDHHHPIWGDVAEELDQFDLNSEATSGPDWAFVQPENRKEYTTLLAEFIDQQNEHEATQRGG